MSMRAEIDRIKKMLAEARGRAGPGEWGWEDGGIVVPGLPRAGRVRRMTPGGMVIPDRDDRYDDETEGPDDDRIRPADAEAPGREDGA